MHLGLVNLNFQLSIHLCKRPKGKAMVSGGHQDHNCSISLLKPVSPRFLVFGIPSLYNKCFILFVLHSV